MRRAAGLIEWTGPAAGATLLEDDVRCAGDADLSGVRMRKSAVSLECGGMCGTAASTAATVALAEECGCVGMHWAGRGTPRRGESSTESSIFDGAISRFDELGQS